MTKLIPKTDRQRFNAMRNFINSCGFILGPSIAGFLFIIGSPNLAILLNSFALFFSAMIILLLPNVEDTKIDSIEEKINLTLILNDGRKILSFSKTNLYVTLVYLLFTGISVFMTALDSLEAAFATEVLSLSEGTYGFLVSIAGAGIIGGSLVNAIFAKQLKINVLMGLGAFFTPIGYLLFAFSNDFLWASIGFFVLTFSLSFANTGFLTFYQNNIPVDIMGRFSSVMGILEAFFIIIFTAIIGVSAELIEIRPVYITGSLLFLLLGIIINFVIVDKSNRKLYVRTGINTD